MPEYLSIATHERIEMISIGSQLAELLRKKAEDGWKDGFLAVYSPHTTCGLTINEGWDPDVKADMERFLAARVPVLRSISSLSIRSTELPSLRLKNRVQSS